METILLLAGHSAHTSILALGKQRQEELEYEASLDCTVILRPLLGMRDSISPQQNKNQSNQTKRQNKLKQANKINAFLDQDELPDCVRSMCTLTEACVHTHGRVLGSCALTAPSRFTSSHQFVALPYLREAQG